MKIQSVQVGLNSSDILKSSHLVQGDNYAVAKLHAMIGGNGSFNENLNFNVDNNYGVVTKEMGDKFKVVKKGSHGGEQKANPNRDEGSPNGVNQGDRGSLSESGNAVSLNYEKINNIIPGDHDYFMVAEGNVKVTKHAKDLMPEDFYSQQALHGEKTFSYGIWMGIGISNGDIAVDTYNENYDAKYFVNPQEQGGGYGIYNGTRWEYYIYNTTTNQWEYYEFPIGK